MSHSELIGSSPKFRGVLDKVDMIASANCRALIQGETGTGKEVIARGLQKLVLGVRIVWSSPDTRPENAR